jgi:hypothetical protein
MPVLITGLDCALRTRRRPVTMLSIRCSVFSDNYSEASDEKIIRLTYSQSRVFAIRNDEYAERRLKNAGD